MATVFFSYSHKDEELRDRLEVALTTMKRQGLHGRTRDHLADSAREASVAMRP